jgi:hypothetical protein
MTLNNSSSHSTAESETPKLPYEELFLSSERYLPVLRLLDSPAWEALCQLLQAERLRYLEQLTDDLSEREFTEKRAVARYLGWFGDYTNGIREWFRNETRVKDEPSLTGSHYLEPDSDSQPA